jgi:crotonobetainyl-CoA:carnitine CoA-transferase CaiB-like acyl-CoA transferase
MLLLRLGCAWGVTPPDSQRLLGQPSGAFGDSIGGAMMAGGVAAALFDRERSGEGSVVDVSLMSVGAWAMALWLGTAMLTGQSNPPLPTTGSPHQPVNPLIGSYRTADGRFVTLMMLQPGRYFDDLCRHLGLEALLDDPRFQTAEGIMEHAEEVGRHIAEVVATRPFAEWVERFETLGVRGRRPPIRSRWPEIHSSR